MPAPAEEVALQRACLEARLQQLTCEGMQLDAWQCADRALLAQVQAHTARLHALLLPAGSGDHQVRHALAEVAVIAHMQRFLLEDALEGARQESRHLAQIRAALQQELALLHPSS